MGATLEPPMVEASRGGRPLLLPGNDVIRAVGNGGERLGDWTGACRHGPSAGSWGSRGAGASSCKGENHRSGKQGRAVSVGSLWLQGGFKVIDFSSPGDGDSADTDWKEEVRGDVV